MRVPHLPILQKIAVYLSQSEASKQAGLQGKNAQNMPQDVVSVGKSLMHERAIKQSEKSKQLKKKDEKHKPLEGDILQDDHEVDIEV